MKVIDVAQNSPEWMLARAGIPTASAFDKIITPARMTASASAEPYMYLLLAECIKGGPIETETSQFMQRGHDLEDDAVNFFEALTDLDTKQVGFCMNDELTIGCSPDRLIGDDAGLEIKCPAAHTHVGYIDRGVLPTAYRAQVQGNMYVTGRDHWHFVSYNPILPALHLVVKRDEEFIKKLDTLLVEFLINFSLAKKRLEEKTGLSLDIDRTFPKSKVA